MSTKTKIAGLVSTLVMATFGAANGHAQTMELDNKETSTDTLKVIGTNKTFRRNFDNRIGKAVMFLKCVNKYGQVYYVEPKTDLYEDEDDVFFIQRGDVIVLNDQAQLIKNLTQEKMKEEFIKSR